MTTCQCGKTAKYWSCCGDPADGSSGTGCTHDDPDSRALCDDCGVEAGYWEADEVHEQATATLHAQHSSGGWSVRDANGGVWWPNEEAAEEIAADEHPATKAVLICDSEPMRGTWNA